MLKLDSVVVACVQFSTKISSILLNQVLSIVIDLFLLKDALQDAIATDFVILKNLIRYNAFYTFRRKMIQYLPI